MDFSMPSQACLREALRQSGASLGQDPMIGRCAVGRMPGIERVLLSLLGRPPGPDGVTLS